MRGIFSRTRKFRSVGAVLAGLALVASAAIGAQASPPPPPTNVFCPPLPLEVTDARLFAGFAGHNLESRVVPYGRRSVIRGRLDDPEGHGIPGEPICIEQRPRFPGAPYTMLGLTNTRADGVWSFILPSGPSRRIRINYGGDPDVTSVFLSLGVRAHATLRLRTRPGRRVVATGRIPGPLAGKRVVALRTRTPGGRKLLTELTRTDVLGRFRIGHTFRRRIEARRLVFWVVVPAQRGYPYLAGRSPKRIVRLSR